VIGSAYIQNLAVNDAHIANLSVSKLLAGTITSKLITLDVSGGSGDAAIRAGKTDFTNVESGFILGIDDSDSDKAKFYIGDSISYFNWTGAGIDIRIAGGDAIKIIGADSGWSGIKWSSSDEANGFEIYTNAGGSNLWIYPFGSGGHNIDIGNTYVTLTRISGIYIDLEATHDANNNAVYSLRGTSDSYTQITIKKSGTYSYFKFNAGGITLSNHKVFNLGGVLTALDDAYADDWNNVADFLHLDSMDDIEVIRGIKGSGIIEPITGLELIDDNTLPKWLCKLDKNKEVERDPDGKPYIPLKVGMSLSWGAIRQLDNIVRKLCKASKIDYESLKELSS